VCDEYWLCVDGCAGAPQCEYDCGQSNAAGQTDYYELLNCLYCDTNTCATACAGACPIEAPPAPGCTDVDCNTCISGSCASFWCGPAIEQCYVTNQDCDSLDACYSPCLNQACYDACDAQFPNGVADWNAMYDCLLCGQDACAVDCAAYCVPAQTCDVGNCDTCINSLCAGTACDTEIQTCDGVTQCWIYVDCVNACTTNGCVNQCANGNPNGVAPGQAVMNCLACDPATCSSDCDAYCPWP
jgi:hypothetical protein